MFSISPCVGAEAAFIARWCADPSEVGGSYVAWSCLGPIVHLQQVMALQISPQHCLLEQYNKSPMKSAVSLIIDIVVILFICNNKKLNSVPLSSRPPIFSSVTLLSRISAPSYVCFTDPGSLITSLQFGLTILSTCWTVLWKGFEILSWENII